jgi:hypothetical protein
VPDPDRLDSDARADDARAADLDMQAEEGVPGAAGGAEYYRRRAGWRRRLAREERDWRELLGEE